MLKEYNDLLFENSSGIISMRKLNNSDIILVSVPGFEKDDLDIKIIEKLGKYRIQISGKTVDMFEQEQKLNLIYELRKYYDDIKVKYKAGILYVYVSEKEQVNKKIEIE